MKIFSTRILFSQPFPFDCIFASVIVLWCAVLRNKTNQKIIKKWLFECFVGTSSRKTTICVLPHRLNNFHFFVNAHRFSKCFGLRTFAKLISSKNAEFGRISESLSSNSKCSDCLNCSNFHNENDHFAHFRIPQIFEWKSPKIDVTHSELRECVKCVSFSLRTNKSQKRNRFWILWKCLSKKNENANLTKLKT